MVLADSSVWIDFLRDQQTKQVAMLERLIGHGQIVIGDLMLVEVLQGIPSDRAFADAQRLFSAFPCVQIVDQAVAEEAASKFRMLRMRGVTVRKTIDTLIATRCIMDGIPLLFSDRDFVPFVEHLGLKDAMG